MKYQVLISCINTGTKKKASIKERLFAYGYLDISCCTAITLSVSVFVCQKVFYVPMLTRVILMVTHRLKISLITHIKNPSHMLGILNFLYIQCQFDKSNNPIIIISCYILIFRYDSLSSKQ